jgi:hypothetical protein
MGPSPRSDRHYEPWTFDQFVPAETAMIEDVFIVGEDPVGEPIIPHVLPDVLDPIELGRLGRHGASVMFSGTPSFSVMCHPARSTNKTA